MPGFKQKAYRALTQLSNDWDILYLSGCPQDPLYTPFAPVGRIVGEGVRTLRWGFTTCPTFAFAFRSTAAAKIIRHMQAEPFNLLFDVTIGKLVHSNVLTSCTTHYWLVAHPKGHSVIQGEELLQEASQT